MGKQQNFINTVKKALGRPSTATEQVEVFTTSPTRREEQLLQTMRSRSPQERRNLLETLRGVAGPLHIDFHVHQSLEETGAAIANLIQEKSPEWGSEKHVCRWDHPLINRLELEKIPALAGVPIYTAPKRDNTDDKGILTAEEKERFRHQVEQSFIGITSADHCAAATATLAIRCQPGLSRSVSLVPSIHIAVIEEKQLLANLEELYTLLKWDPKEREKGLTNNLSLISGPSKTGDIELIMVHGAHGPRELHLFVVKEK